MLHPKYVRFFTTLSNRTRLEIVFALRKKTMNVSEITRTLGYDQSTISNNLRVLKHCGFVEMKQNGKERIYSINKQSIEKMLKIIDWHTDKYCRHLVEGHEHE